jgi:hypothetical protein
LFTADCRLRARGDGLHLAALIADAKGARVLRCAVTGADPDALGAAAAARLRELGADAILAQLQRDLRRGPRGADR